MRVHDFMEKTFNHSFSGTALPDAFYENLPNSTDTKILSIIYAIIAPMALGFNGIFIIYILQLRKKWGSHDVLILNISISDFVCVAS